MPEIAQIRANVLNDFSACQLSQCTSARFMNIISLETNLKCFLSSVEQFSFFRSGELHCLRQWLVKYNPGFSHRSCCQYLHTSHRHWAWFWFFQHSPSSFLVELPGKSPFLSFGKSLLLLYQWFSNLSLAESPEGLVKTHLHSRVSDSVSPECGPRMCIYDNFPSEVNSVGEGFSLWEPSISFIPGKVSSLNQYWPKHLLLLFLRHSISLENPLSLTQRHYLHCIHTTWPALASYLTFSQLPLEEGIPVR